jgi:hypothetical protein
MTSSSSTLGKKNTSGVLKRDHVSEGASMEISTKNQRKAWKWLFQILETRPHVMALLGVEPRGQTFTLESGDAQVTWRIEEDALRVLEGETVAMELPLRERELRSETVVPKLGLQLDMVFGTNHTVRDDGVARKAWLAAINGVGLRAADSGENVRLAPSGAWECGPLAFSPTGGVRGPADAVVDLLAPDFQSLPPGGPTARTRPARCRRGAP